MRRDKEYYKRDNFTAFKRDVLDKVVRTKDRKYLLELPEEAEIELLKWTKKWDWDENRPL